MNACSSDAFADARWCTRMPFANEFGDLFLGEAAHGQVLAASAAIP